jgi:hypothetical protein
MGDNCDGVGKTRTRGTYVETVMYFWIIGKLVVSKDEGRDVISKEEACVRLVLLSIV